MLKFQKNSNLAKDLLFSFHDPFFSILFFPKNALLIIRSFITNVNLTKFFDELNVCFILVLEGVSEGK